jgi:lysophospholipase L1-like esterase
MCPDGSGHALYNLGIRGNTVSQVHGRLAQEFRQRGELRNRFPDLILLSVGVNDSPRLGSPGGKQLTDLATFQLQLTNLLTSAQKLCPVLFVGMTPVDESRMPFLDCFYYNHRDQYHYKEITKEACHAYHIPYLDIFDLWLGRGTAWVGSHLSSDGLHPNVKGYQVLLEDVINWEPISQIAGRVNCQLND